MCQNPLRKPPFTQAALRNLRKNFSIVVARPHRVNYFQTHAISGALIYVPCLEFYRKLLNLIDLWGSYRTDLGQYKSKQLPSLCGVSTVVQ